MLQAKPEFLGTILGADPVPLRYYRREFLRHTLRDTKRTALSLLRQHFTTPEIPVVTKRQDDIFHDPGVKRVATMPEGFNSNGECNVCGTQTTDIRTQEFGCPVCRLARLYSVNQAGESIPTQSEEDIYRAYLTRTTKEIESLTDKELNSFLQNIIGIQSVLDVAKRKARIRQGAIEKEIVKRSPKTKLSMKKESESSEPKQRLTKEQKAEKNAEALGINLADLLKFVGKS